MIHEIYLFIYLFFSLVLHLLFCYKAFQLSICHQSSILKVLFYSVEFLLNFNEVFELTKIEYMLNLLQPFLNFNEE